MRALVTGAGGFIGRQLVERLRRDGAEVHGLDIGGDERVVDTYGSILDPDKVEAAMWKARPQCVFHLAAQSDIDASWDRPAEDAETNLVATLQLWQRCVQHGVVRMVFPSSWAAARAASPYGVSKAAAEASLWLLSQPCPRDTDGDGNCGVRWCRRCAGKGVPGLALLRLANVYGPGGDNVVTTLARRIVRGEPVTVARGGRDFVHVDDVVEAIVLAAGTPGRHVSRIGTGRLTSLAHLARTLAVLADTPDAEVRVGDDHVGDVKLDPDGARIGWTARIPLEIGAKSVLAAVRS